MDIRPLSAGDETISALSELLVETVANGGSVSFMHPLPLKAAEAFWSGALAAADKGERVVLGAFEGDRLMGTVSLFLDFPPNQPHRAEIGKLMTAVAFRGRGVASALMAVAETIAAERSRTHLVLDTATDDGAAPLYEKLGYTRVGEIPDFAFKPHGGLTGTILFWKRIGAHPATA
ncbi:GNAT family N-acetyltransferase [Corticibacterium sp. UT-5YL-CI-8]|nr:GNAT family N-acetyltransferase [Tianweitania sp. UT-5YL-CI-8]